MIVEISDKSLSIRPIQDEDLMVLNEIYGSTREKELKQVVEWNDEQKKTSCFSSLWLNTIIIKKIILEQRFILFKKTKLPLEDYISMKIFKKKVSELLTLLFYQIGKIRASEKAF